MDIFRIKRGRTRKFDRIHQNRQQRWAEIGRDFEKTVCLVLEKMVEDEQILGFTHHPPHSEEDREGMDFTVNVLVNGVSMEKSFGVTISLQRWNCSKMIHPDIPQWCFPGGNFNQENLIKKVIGLFRVEKEEAPQIS